MAKKYRDVKRALRAAGWVTVRTKGSHEIWAHPDGRAVAVAGGGKDKLEVPVGTLAMLRQRTGLKELR